MSLGKSRTEFPFRSNPLRRQQMNRRSFLKTTSTADGAAAAGSKLSTLAIGQSVQAGPTFRRPKIILPVPTPEAKFQHVEDGVPDTQLTREATGLLREFSTPLLFSHSHRVFFWANRFKTHRSKTLKSV